MPNALPPVAPESARLDPSISQAVGELSRLHRLLLVTDAGGRAVWTSDALRARCGREADIVLDERPGDDGLSEVHVTLNAPSGSSRNFVGFAMPLGAGDGDARLTLSILRPGAGAWRCDGDPQASADSLGAILGNAPDPVLAFDCNGFIAYANTAVERLLGRSPREILHRPLAVFVSNRAELSRLAVELAGSGEVQGRDVELQLVDGTRAWVSVSARAIRTRRHGDRPVGWAVFLRDISKRRRIEAELERKNGELEHYVQTVSHDLRSPLVSLLGFSRLLRQDYGERLDETGRHFLGRIEQAARTMETLIHDVLEFSRIGKRGEERRLVDPRPVLLQLQAELKPRLDERAVSLELPPSPPLLLCDRTRLYQVFSNLIGNAVDHMGPSEDPRIEISIEEEPAFHHLTVTDNGQGIPPEEHERVFEVFHTIGARADGQRASGIGLAIVKKIAEAHGGRVWVESAPGAGASFHVLLPRG
jgi:two-component system, LuxR family, sensor kinase FixL